MGFVEIQFPDTNEVVLLKDGRRETYKRELCDGCALYRSPLGARKVSMKDGDCLWFCRECAELYIDRRPVKADDGD